MSIVLELASLKSCLEEIVQIDDEEISTLVNGYLEDATVDVPEIQGRHLMILVEFSNDVQLKLTLPKTYPAERPLVSMLGLSSRDLQSEINHRVQDLYKDVSIAEDTILYEVVMLVKSILQDASDKAVDRPMQATGKQSVVKQQTQGHNQYGRIMFYAHHLLAVSKRKDMQRMSRELDMHILCKVGYPGLIAAEGERSSIDHFVKEIKSMRWHTIALKYEVYKNLIDAESWKTKAILNGPFVETTDMSAFAKELDGDHDWMQSIIH